jgi:hypothetical protein
MKRVLKAVAFVALVVSTVFMWRAEGPHDGTLMAQQSVPTITSMYTGDDGLSHFREVPYPTGLLKVVGVQFNNRRATPIPNPNPNPPAALNWHPEGNRRYVITLNGKAEIVASGESKPFIADRDHILLAEDLTGKGHTTKGIDWVTVFVEIDKPPTATN